MHAYWPPETHPIKTLWLGWPSHAHLWGPSLHKAQQEIASLVHALSKHGVPVTLLASGEKAKNTAQKHCAHDGCTILNMRFGDIWIRDTGPVFMQTQTGPYAIRFRFNGWGGKYTFPDDEDVAKRLAQKADIPLLDAPEDFICEGGALETDGIGTLCTTRQCLLNKNRNPHLSVSDVEKYLKQTLNIERIIWFEQGLDGDHTDGHIDNLVRFVHPGLAICQKPNGADDPNQRIYDAIRRTLDRARNAAGDPIDFAEITSPGLITDENNKPLPASHMNMIITEKHIFLPQYTSESIQCAKQELHAVFENHTIIPLKAETLCTGGGAFHCLSLHQWRPN